MIRRLWSGRKLDAWAVATIAVVTSSALGRLAWLLILPGPTGQDGYYYLLQVHGLSLGEVTIPTTNLLPLVAMKLAAWVWDPVMAIKVVAATASWLLSLAVARVSVRLTNIPALGFVAAILVVIPTFHNFFVVEFVANLCGLACAVWFIARVNEYGLDKTAGVLFVGAALSHPVGGLLAGVTGLLVLAARQRWLHLAVIGATTAAVMCAAIWAREWRSLLGDTLTWLPTVSFGHVSGTYTALAIVVAAGVLAHGVWLRRSKPDWSAPPPVIAALVLFLIATAANPFFIYRMGVDGLPDRLAMTAWVPAAILVPWLMSVIRVRSWGSFAYIVVLLAVTLASALGRVMPVGGDYAFLAERESLRSAVGRGFQQCSNRPVVAEHGLQFLISFLTGRPASAESSGVREQEAWLIRRGNQLSASQVPAASCVLGPHLLVEAEYVESWLLGLEPTKRAQILRLNRRGVGRLLTERTSNEVSD